MKSSTPLDYAVFQLSPKRSRCELLVSGDGNTERLASGLMKPFVTNLKFAEEQLAMSSQSIKLDVGRRKNADSWFTKGTLERFVRFVSTPEILELVNTLDAEMSQLESARRIYSQGAEDQHSGAGGGGGSGVTAAADATKKELRRAIDLRLAAVQQDLATACSRTAAAGFNPDSVSELQSFAEVFGAQRLNEACIKFASLCERRPDLIKTWTPNEDYRAVRSSYGSDMSIDDEPTSPTFPQTGTHQLSTPDLSFGQQQQSAKLSTFQQTSRLSSRESSVEPIDTDRKNDALAGAKDKEQEISGNVSTSTASVDQLVPIQTSQQSRRLSVQDRINLFENKQKETSGGAGKTVVGKSVELRRQPSDVSSSAPEKAVLRRWSGASDMSIDLSGEKKDIESPLCTPSSSLVPEDRIDTASYTKAEPKILPARVGDSGSKNQTESPILSGREESFGVKQFTDSSGKSEDASDSERSTHSGPIAVVGSEGKKDLYKTQSRSLLNRNEKSFSQNQADLEIQSKDSKTLPGDKSEQVAFSIHQTPHKRSSSGLVGSEAQTTEHKETVDPLPPIRASPSDVTDMKAAVNLRQPGPVETSYEKEDTRSRDQLSSRSHFRTTRKPVTGESIHVKGDSGSKLQEGYGYLGVDQNSSSSQSSFEVVQKKELGSLQKPSGSPAMHIDDSANQKRKFEKPISASEQIKKVQGTRNVSASMSSTRMASDISKTISSSKMVTDNQDMDSFSTSPADQFHRVRQSKGKQELNDELKMKANELEKLFAQHKLRVPGDQSNSTNRSRPVDRQNEHPASLSHGKLKVDGASVLLPPNSVPSPEPSWMLENTAEDNEVEDTKMVESESYEDGLISNLAGLSFSEGSRGKFYKRYMQKREAKLQEEWSSKRAEKEAKLKAMHDSLERSRAEMKAKFSGSQDGENTVISARQRTERLRSFNKRSITGREQTQLDFGQSDYDEDMSDVRLQKNDGEDQSFAEPYVVEGLGKTVQNKKALPTKGLSSATSRTPAAPIPRSAVRASNLSSGRRKVQPENPLAQSVPNFSDLRKENTKAYSASSKAARPQLRNYARNKTANEEMPLAKEEKPRRSQSLKKNSVSGVDVKDMSALDCEVGSLTTLRSDKEEPHDKYSKNFASKSFPKKGSDIRQRELLEGIMAGEPEVDESEVDDFTFDSEDLVNLATNEENHEERFETLSTIHHSNFGNGGPRLDQASDRLTFGLTNDALGSLPQRDSAMLAELPAAVAPGLNPLEHVLDSPGESPVSWNSHAHPLFSYSHEMSDIDASVDSPIGSPASWNSHALESDAARMRKKWGVAQKPMLVSSSMQNHSRKDMTKGFKRLLKFGRKSRGTENFVDWISATTSEGDDDTEDGRDPTYRLSEDVGKSRMGSAQGNPSDDSFIETEFFSDQVQSLRTSIPAPPANFKLREEHFSGSSIKAPRSFFSLSSFRSKASESKPR